MAAVREAFRRRVYDEGRRDRKDGMGRGLPSSESAVSGAGGAGVIIRLEGGLRTNVPY